MCWDSAHFTESWLLYEIRNRRITECRKKYFIQFTDKSRSITILFIKCIKFIESIKKSQQRYTNQRMIIRLFSTYIGHFLIILLNKTNYRMVSSFFLSLHAWKRYITITRILSRLTPAGPIVRRKKYICSEASVSC